VHSSKLDTGAADVLGRHHFSGFDFSGDTIVRHKQPRYDRPRPWFAPRWLTHLGYARRGRIDGRRGMPLVTSATALRTPTLHRLADEVHDEIERVRARGQEATAAERIELAELTAAGGPQGRAAQRLATMTERLEEIEAAGPQTGRRFGEDHLPDELIATRRVREHARRVKQARKRVEDERTALSVLLAHQGQLEATIEEQTKLAESQARTAGHARRTHAFTYLNGALRKHPDRPLVSLNTRQLLPSVDNTREVTS
jgi:hypothetical protein